MTHRQQSRQVQRRGRGGRRREEHKKKQAPHQHEAHSGQPEAATPRLAVSPTRVGDWPCTGAYREHRRPA